MSTSEDPKVTAWMKRKMHLPAFMRDFHDQKELFKTIWERQRPYEVEMLKELNWAVAHVFVIDCFLWFMARRGYTLQKTRANMSFRDIEADIAENEAKRREHFDKLLADTIKQK